LEELGRYTTNLEALKKKTRYKVSNTELAKPAAFSVCYFGRQEETSA